MSINKRLTAVMDGTTGGTIEVIPDYKGVQVSVSGRTTGILTITGQAYGGEAAEPVVDGTIDLGAGQYTRWIENVSFESLTLAPDATGNDFTVTVTQWPH